jgi:hypothetical protein
MTRHVDRDEPVGTRSSLSGLWVPVITPLRVDESVDISRPFRRNVTISA